MDLAITTEGGLGQMTFDQATNYINNVYLSLMVDRGSFFQNPGFGSRLYLLKRAKLTPQTAALAVDYVKEALQWMIDAGRATAVDVITQEDPQVTGRLNVQVNVTQANGWIITFNTFVGVV
ncbi:MAG: phage GP46 family protein [Nitrospiraceae bacterium]|nr:phage GP46 family protein [Nitrospiraceae bacterium]